MLICCVKHPIYLNFSLNCDKIFRQMFQELKMGAWICDFDYKLHFGCLKYCRAECLIVAKKIFNDSFKAKVQLLPRTETFTYDLELWFN